MRQSIFTSSVEGRVGVEIEWFAVYEDDPTAYVPLNLLEKILDPSAELPCGGRLSFEPGGQVEMSSVPGQSVSATCTATASDIAFIKKRLAGWGIRLVGAGLDPHRPGRRVLELPRYRAMESYFDAFWPEGRSMMRSTASVHVNLDVEGIEDGAERWRLVHALGPTLSAAFANSSVSPGGPTGFKSTRLALWQAIDPSRTLPTPPVADPVSVWSRYALAARVMFIGAGGTAHPVHDELSFQRWMQEGHELGFPDLEDLRVHLTTLFPPIRPKAWLELRMIDALPEPWWRVPVAIASMVYDEEAVQAVEAAVTPTADLWAVAARYGMEHPLLAESARVCFAAALDALGRLEVDEETGRVVAAYRERFILKGRCPADEQLDAWGRGSSLLDLDAEPAQI